MAAAEKGRGVRAGGRRARGGSGGSPQTHDGGEGSAVRGREAAIRRLERIEESGAFVARLGGDLAPEEERLASDLVAGVTRLRRRLDFLLAPHVRGGLDRLDGPVRQALRIGLYDLVERETPAHAAVGEAVEAASRVSHRGGVALVNAVLRAAARGLEGASPALPATGDAAEDLGIWQSYPSWLVRRWLARFGPEDATALLEAGNAAPAFGLRVNPLKTTVEAVGDRLDELNVAWERSPWLDDVLRVHRLQPVLHAGIVHEGLASVQDEAAAMVVRVLDPQPGETILDAAAAPGGKALYAAERMGNAGRVLALDAHAGKLRLLTKAAIEHGLGIIETVAADLREAPLDAVFDRVLLDAPCSGTGVLGRRADLRWNREEADIESLTRLQDELLDAAAGAVRPGGLLVYATCSLEPEENRDRVDAFLARHADFAPEHVAEPIPTLMRTDEGDYAALPQVHGTDGAFAARLRRAL